MSESVLSKSVFIVAAEDSSALYAERLLESWKSSKQKITTFGIGNAKMEKQGFEILAKTEDMSAVGFQEVLPKLRYIKSIFKKVVTECEKRKPDVVLLLDYPGFNLGLAKVLKKKGFRVVYYISPQVWAWKKGRVKTIKKYIDKMLVILPFEKEFYDQNDVESEFVGHPLLDELNPKLDDDEFRKEVRQRHGFSESDHVLGLMPGSRISELKHHMRVQIETAEKVVENRESVKIAVLIAPGLEAETIKKYMGETTNPVTFIKRDPFEMALLSDTVLCASGTATMTVGLMKTPMVIMYKANVISAVIVRTFIRMKFYGLVNLILGEEVAKEILQEKANPKILSEALMQVISGEERERAISELSKLRYLLGEKGATERVSQAVLREMG